MSDLKKNWRGPLYAGSAGATAVAVLTLFAYWHSGSGEYQLSFALGFPLVFGVLCAWLQRRRFHSWLAGIVFGFIAGAVSAVPLLAAGSFEGEFYVSSATLVFFIVLGFLLGAAGEFVRLLHFIAHGGSILKYPGLPPAPETPEGRPQLRS